MAIKRPLAIPILVIGATSISAQIVLLRELIVVFYGNEVSVGIMLAAWLLLGALGSLIAGRFVDKIKDGPLAFSLGLLFLSVVIPFVFILVRGIKEFFGLLPGEIAPLGALIVSSPIVIAPICLPLGFLFALACRIVPVPRDSKIGTAYVLESLGAILAGLLVSLLLIRFLSGAKILAGLGLLNALACLYITKDISIERFKGPLRILISIYLVASSLFISLGGLDRLDKKTKELEWRPFRLIESRDSIYGNIAVAEREAQVSFFTNGLHNFTVPDQLSQEEAVHFALSQHKDPRKILLVGGGAGGMLWELLKYPGAEIDYVELDPLIVELSQRHLSRQEYYALDDERVNFIHSDGRFYIKNTDLRYDAIILSTPDPYTAQLNRYYTREFFGEAKRILAQGGILSFSVSSSENYVSRELGRFLASIYNTLASAYKDVIFVPGDTLFFVASNEMGRLTTDYGEISRRLSEKGVEAGFVNEHYLFSKLSKDRLDYITDVLEANRDVGRNYDFRPISYYFDMILWSSYFSSPLRKIAQVIDQKRLWIGFSLLYLAVILFALLLRKKKGGVSPIVLAAVGTTGFSEIAYEIVVILSFQIIYGFLYYKLGLILTSFMVGLFLGSLLISRNLSRLERPLDLFIKVQVAVIIYPILLPAIFHFISQANSSPMDWVGSNIIFPSLPIVAGFIGGFQFPLASKICLEKSSGVGRTGGLAYGIDLLGACLGAAIVSTFLIPIMGIFQTCFAIGLLNLSVLAGIFINKEKYR